MSRLRATLPFVASSSFSLLGNSIAGVVLPLVLLAKTGDALAAGTLAIVCALPQVLAGVLAVRCLTASIGETCRFFPTLYLQHRSPPCRLST